MVNYGGVGAPLGLGTFPGIVDNKGIEEGQVLKRHLGIAGLREPDTLPGQPFKGAVFAHVDHGVSLVNVPYPPVVGNVMMRGYQIRAMVDGNRIFAETPRRLESHEHIAQIQSSYGQGLTGSINIARRVAPGILQLLLHLGRKTLEPLGILPSVHVTCRKTHLFLGQRIAIVAAPLNKPVHEFVPVGWYVFYHVPGSFESVQQVDYRSGSVQPNRVANPGILGGVVAHDDSNALFGVGLEAQCSPFSGQPGQRFHAIGNGYIPLQPGSGKPAAVAAGSLFLKGYGNRDDSTIKFRQSYVHRRVYGPQAQRAFFPFLAGAGADYALDYGNVQRVQQVNRPTCSNGGALLAEVTHGQAHGVDNAVHPGPSAGVGHEGSQSTAALPILFGIVFQAVGIDRQYVYLPGFQAPNQIVHELEIATHPVGPIEEKANAGLTGLETGSNIAIHVDGFRRVCVGMIYSFPRHGLRRFVAELAAKVSITKKKEQVAEVVDSAPHQVGEDRFQFRHRNRTSGNQVFIPFLVTRAGNKRNCPFAAQAHQRIECFGHGPLPAQ